MVVFRFPALARARQLPFLVLACALAFLCADLGAQSLAGRPANLVTVQLAREGDVSIVTLEADGPLPEPTFGVAHDPFRFYVDFPNVSPESRGVLNSTDPLVVRVRVAAYSTEPLISRVVLDLKRELPIRVDTDGRGAGRIRILVGMNKTTTAAKATPPAQTAVPPVPALPAPSPAPVTSTPQGAVQAPPPAKPPMQSPPAQTQNPPAPPPQTNKPASPASPPPTQTPPVAPVTPPPVPTPPSQPPSTPTQTTPSNPPAPPPQKSPDPVPVPGGTSGSPPPPAPGFNPLSTPPAGAAKTSRGDDRYRSQVSVPLDQLRALRPLLASIDLLKAETPTGLPAAIERTETIRQSLAAIKPPPDQGPTHDMLLQSCTLAQRALKLRVSGSDQAALRNAGSAAAGALLLLDRVCIELGCDATPIKR